VKKETQKSPSKNTKYEKTKLKYLPRTSPNYRNNYYFFTKHQKGMLAPSSKSSSAFRMSTNKKKSQKPS